MVNILIILLGYLYGSIPFALIIGKIFYNTDIREKGSGNLGGTNAGRVLGKKIGLIVIILDALKAIIATSLALLLSKTLNLDAYVPYFTGLFCIIGHCFPIFAQFKGGKAVSTFFGYLIVISPSIALISLLIFLLVLKISKYVSLSSILAATTSIFISSMFSINIYAKISLMLAGLLLIYRHIDNIKRLKNKTETKITWLK